MAYFLGRDVKVAITTEDESHGISSSAASASDPTAGDVIEVRPGTGNEADIKISAGDSATSNYNPFTDVTGVDITLGKIDEDIAYMGQRTALKAEIKNETTLVITKKKNSKFWDEVFMNARYGINSADSNNLHDGLTQPATGYGYRLYLCLTDGTEVITLKNCTFTDHSVSLNVDGTTEETLTFMSHIQPGLGTDVDIAENTAL
tara:strand:+ start:53 stop:664 length:612 start_codon:yes stop_codon:yes gene_type:complete